MSKFIFDICKTFFSMITFEHDYLCMERNVK